MHFRQDVKWYAITVARLILQWDERAERVTPHLPALRADSVKLGRKGADQVLARIIESVDDGKCGDVHSGTRPEDRDSWMLGKLGTIRFIDSLDRLHELFLSCQQKSAHASIYDDCISRHLSKPSGRFFISRDGIGK